MPDEITEVLDASVAVDPAPLAAALVPAAEPAPASAAPAQHEVNRLAGELCDAIQRARDGGASVTLPCGVEQFDRIKVVLP